MSPSTRARFFVVSLARGGRPVVGFRESTFFSWRSSTLVCVTYRPFVFFEIINTGFGRTPNARCRRVPRARFAVDWIGLAGAVIDLID
jgi:hypothetical protein